ncbi:Major facilitator superfamily domain general substrate transporter [Penicillium cf. griseofulvum]|nr:Major facilitator superfamily domain general substrate transporter [Penicillium cf. griseofulvum]
MKENEMTDSTAIEHAERSPDPTYAHKEEKIDLESRSPDVVEFCTKYDLMGHIETFKKGALISQNPASATSLPEISEEEREALEREHTHKWSQPWQLYFLASMCSLAAAVQGMDETVNNGAQAIYFAEDQLNITSKNIQGLVVGAPYLACAIIGCWLTEPLNRFFARRGTIFISCVIAAVASVWEGVANTWVNLFIARFVLGLGIGSKSSTVPVYAAECSPAPIRGALVMMWQMWTAFGIMLGNIMGVAFMSLDRDISWRLMLGSTVVLPLIVCAQVYFCPESPRWLIQQGKIQKAYTNFRILRPTDIQAARDLYYAHVGVEIERKINKGKNFFTMFIELFTIPRNRRATLASWIVMFMQQFCGVNVIAYYSTSVFTEASYSLTSALLASMGTGILNWVFALPAFFTIDTWGRRNLLLFTFPFLAITLLWTGFSFWIEEGNETSKRGLQWLRRGCTCLKYSTLLEKGPSHSHMPPSVSRCKSAMSVCHGRQRPPGALISFYPSLGRIWLILSNPKVPSVGMLLGWFLVLMFVPETKSLTLEELDQVFSVSTRKHASFQIKNAVWHFRVWILRQRLEPLPEFYQGAENLAEVGDITSKEGRKRDRVHKD